MQHYLLRGRVEWGSKTGSTLFGVFKFDEIRGNLILGFIKVTSSSNWSTVVTAGHVP